jgi:hypothetical protein
MSSNGLTCGEGGLKRQIDHLDWRMFTEQQLNQCFSDYAVKHKGRKEDYFAVLHLAKRFTLSQEEALRWVTIGGFDYGIDAYYLDAGNLYLYQFKWSDSVIQMAQSIDRIVDVGLDAVFGNELVDTRRNDAINRLRADVREHSAEIKHVFMYFISKGVLPRRGENQALDSRLEDLERSTSKLKKFFGEDIEIFIRVNDDATPPPRFNFVLKSSSANTYSFNSGETIRIITASLVDFVRMYEKMNLRLFQKKHTRWS